MKIKLLITLLLITGAAFAMEQKFDNDETLKNRQEKILADLKALESRLDALEGPTVQKKYVTNDNVQAMCLAVYQQAIKDGFVPDAIVALARGGTIPGGFLAGEAMFDNRNFHIMCLESYDDKGKQTKIKLTVPFFFNALTKHKSLLIVDDLVDSGETMKFTQRLLKENLPITTVLKTAVLFYKKTSSVKPDYYAQETKDWIVFPWEKQS